MKIFEPALGDINFFNFTLIKNFKLNFRYILCAKIVIKQLISFEMNYELRTFIFLSFHSNE